MRPNLGERSTPNIAQAEQVPLEAATVRAAALDEALQTVGAVGDVAVADERAEQRGPLPLVVPLGLRDGRTEAFPDPLLQRLDQLALALQILDLTEVKVDLDQADEAGH